MQTIIEPTDPDPVDPKVKAVAARALSELKLTSLKVAMNHRQPAVFKLPAGPDTVEGVLAQRFSQLPAERRDRAATVAATFVQSPAAARRQEFGDFADLDLHGAEPLAAAVNRVALPAALRFTPAMLADAPIQTLPGAPVAAGPVAAALPPRFRSLRFRVHNVHCIDETGISIPLFGEPGSDEILLGGTAVDETGDVSVIPSFKVGDFDDGDQKNFVPPRTLVTFDLREGTKFPRGYFVTLTLAEEDQGGFSSFLNKLLDKIKERVVKMIRDAIGDLTGSGAVISAIIEKAVRWVVGKFFDWLARLWGDDVFPVATRSLLVPSLTATFNGGKTDTVNRTVDFKGHNGHYQVTYDWQLVA